MEYLICRKKGAKRDFVKTPSLSSITKLIERVNDRASYEDSTVRNLAERLSNATHKELFEKNIVYHRDCYSEIANVEKLERAKNATQIQQNMRIHALLKEKMEGR